MTVHGIGMVRDEVDIIEVLVRHTLAHVDHLTLLDNRSADGTSEILARLVAEFDGTLEVIDDPEVGYYQARKTTALAHRAGEQGATWVVPVDADEIWTAGAGRVGDYLLAQPATVDIVEGQVFHHGPTGLDDMGEPNPVVRQRWRNRPEGMGKVAVRLAPGLAITQGNHGAFYFDAQARRCAPAKFVVHHYPCRNPEQYLKKIRNGAEAYAAATDLPTGMGHHWRDLGLSNDEQIIDQYWRYHVNDPTADEHLIEDPAVLWGQLE